MSFLCSLCMSTNPYTCSSSQDFKLLISKDLFFYIPSAKSSALNIVYTQKKKKNHRLIMAYEALSDSILPSFPDPPLSLPDLLFTVHFCWAPCVPPNAPGFKCSQAFVHTDSPGITLNSPFFTLSTSRPQWRPLLGAPSGHSSIALTVHSTCNCQSSGLCPPLSHEPCEDWNYHLFMVVSPELSIRCST